MPITDSDSNAETHEPEQLSNMQKNVRIGLLNKMQSNQNRQVIEKELVNITEVCVGEANELTMDRCHKVLDALVHEFKLFKELQGVTK